MGGCETGHQDAVLRRLHFFESFGVELADDYVSLTTQLRARDRREQIRPPYDEVEPLDVRTLQRVAATPRARRHH